MQQRCLEVCVNVRGVSVRHSERQVLGGRKREREWGERERVCQWVILQDEFLWTWWVCMSVGHSGWQVCVCMCSLFSNIFKKAASIRFPRMRSVCIQETQTWNSLHAQGPVCTHTFHQPVWLSTDEEDGPFPWIPYSVVISSVVMLPGLLVGPAVMCQVEGKSKSPIHTLAANKRPEPSHGEETFWRGQPWACSFLMSQGQLSVSSHKKELQ